jgi:hypothetical protein
MSPPKTNFYSILLNLYPVIKFLLDSRQNFGLYFLRKQMPVLRNTYAYQPNTNFSRFLAHHTDSTTCDGVGGKGRHTCFSQLPAAPASDEKSDVYRPGKLCTVFVG